MTAKDVYLKVEPIEGAAEYFANFDKDKNNKPALWMKVKADKDCSEDCYYIVSHHKTIEAARIAANTMQQKENRSIEKSNQPIKQESKTDNYIPFGSQWQIEIAKLTKVELIAMLRKALMSNQDLKETVQKLIAELECYQLQKESVPVIEKAKQLL